RWQGLHVARLNLVWCGLFWWEVGRRLRARGGWSMDTPTIVMVMAFLMMISLLGMVGLAVSGRHEKLKSRLNELSGTVEPTFERLPGRAVSQAMKTTLPTMGKHLMPSDAEEQSLLKARLTHAGIYHPQAV